MKFAETAIPGMYHIIPNKLSDERGWFMRSYCMDEFKAHSIDFTTVQCNISFNHQQYTLRGMHFQKAPKAEAKLVRCQRGRIFDVAVDLRPDSSAYCKWVGIELSAAEGNALFIPEGCAHGFLTLEDACEVHYQMGSEYAAALSSGVRFDDPAFNIAWPAVPKVIGQRDKEWPDYDA